MSTGISSLSTLANGQLVEDARFSVAPHPTRQGRPSAGGASLVLGTCQSTRGGARLPQYESDFHGRNITPTQ